MPLARDPHRGASRDILFERSSFKGRAFAAIRTRRYVYVMWQRFGRELYDLKRDPYELQNLAADPAYASVRRRLLPKLLALKNCSVSSCRQVRGN